MDTLTTLLVDSCPLRRARLLRLLPKTSRLFCASSTASLSHALIMIRSLNPDVVLVETDMLNSRDGMAFRAKMRADGIAVAPVREVSGADVSCLRIAADELRFTETGLVETGALERLIKRVADHRASPPQDGRFAAPDLTAPPANCVVLIGASTGGVDAIATVLSSFPAACPPTLIVQHMRHDFLAAFAQRLNSKLPPRVLPAMDRHTLRSGEVLIAPGEKKHLELTSPRRLMTRLVEGQPISGHQPSVDALFNSCARMAEKGITVVAALLTGMGADGAEGLRAIRQAGGHTIAQDEASCVVYGMPRAAARLDAADEILPLDQIGPALLKAAKEA